MNRLALGYALALLALLSFFPRSSRAQTETPVERTSDAGAVLSSVTDAEDGGESSANADADSNGDGDQAPSPRNPFTEAAPADVESSLSRALSGPDVSFCNATDTPDFSDSSLCSLSHVNARQRCPALARACAESSQHHDWDFKSLAWLGDLAFWLVLAALVVALGLALRHVIGAARRIDHRAPVRPDLPAEAVSTPHRPGEADVARLWALAEQSASLSRFDDAVAAVQGALIHSLRIAGKLQVSPAQTNGDYLRALRPDPALHGTARAVFRAVEGVQFGGTAASAQLYRELFERVRPIVQLAITAVVLLVLGFSQSGCSKGFGSDPEGNAHGFGVLTRLLTEQHVRVRERVRSLDVIAPTITTILVVEDQSEEAWGKLFAWASEGGTLIVANGSSTLATETNVHFAAHDYTGPLALAADFEPARLELSAVAEHTLELPAPRSPFDQIFATAEGRPYVAARTHGDGRIIFFSDLEFLENASLSVGDNAFFALSIVRQPGRVLEIVGPWTGGGADSTVRALLHAGLGVLLLQLLAFALLFGWSGGAAFGTRRDPPSQRRRAFREHVLALGANYRRARATRFALATYGAWLTDRLRDRLSPQQPIGLIDLAGRVASRVPEPESELVGLLVETRQAQEDSAEARPSPADLDTLHRLETLAVRVGGSK